MIDCSTAFTRQPDDIHQLRRSKKAILFADVVDSVRLVAADEENVIRRWLDFVTALESDMINADVGRLVKRLGDGLLFEFENVSAGVKAAFDLQKRLEVLNEGVIPDARIEMRFGVDIGNVFSSADNDLYGQHVNIASRLAGAARPGQIVASDGVRDALASDPAVEFEDLGAVFLKNVKTPVHSYLIYQKNKAHNIVPILASTDILPTVATLPIVQRSLSSDPDLWGELLTEDLVVALSRSSEMNVISRLSTAGVLSGTIEKDQIGQALNADFVLSGAFRGDTDHILLDLSLTEVRTNYVIWTQRNRIATAELLQQNAIFSDLASLIHGAMMNTEMRRALAHPVPTLQGYSVLMGAVALMHRLSPRDFALAGELLTSLIERIPNTPLPLAWKSRWHVLKVQQGWSDDVIREAGLALECTRRALDLDPTNPAALIAEGFVRNNLLHELDEAEDLFNAALEHSPNDATGRLLRGTLHAFRGEGALAVADSERAMHLAPLDPNRFFFQALAAGACLSAGDNARALLLADNSIRLNRSHTSTLRIKAVAELRLGQEKDALTSIAKLMKLQPNFTLTGWRNTAASAKYPVGEEFAQALKTLGVPT